LLLRKGESVRGHEFHFSTVTVNRPVEFGFASDGGRGSPKAATGSARHRFWRRIPTSISQAIRRWQTDLWKPVNDTRAGLGIRDWMRRYEVTSPYSQVPSPAVWGIAMTKLMASEIRNRL